MTIKRKFLQGATISLCALALTVPMSFAACPVSGCDKGYDNANDVAVRIPYTDNEGLDITNFSIGDIIVYGNLDLDINRQQDLKGYNIYNITSINDDNFGGNPHIYLGGK